MKSFQKTILSSFIKNKITLNTSIYTNRVNQTNFFSTSRQFFSESDNNNKKQESENYDSINNSFKFFGNEKVDRTIHQSLVNNIFSNVAEKYDVMNDAMSLGVHRLWKREFVNKIGYIKPHVSYDSEGKEIKKPLKIIDVAGGTGDISYRILEKADEYFSKNFDIYPVEITVVDINENMINEGIKRAERENVSDKLSFKVCNAETLDFLEDNSVDLYTISFGIRNCTNRDKVLKEAHRVLKKGGRFMCMEFSEVTIPVLNQIYNTYSDIIIPELGGLIAGDKESYAYLVESIRKFPKQEDFKTEIKLAGFKFVNYINLSGGICAVHSGTKL